jgi:hypothetical protein
MEMISTIAKPLLFFLRQGNRVLRAIPIIDDFEDRIRARWLQSVIVRRVRQPGDPDLHAALALYEQRLDGELRFQSSDIIRWLVDDLKIGKGANTGPRDYFLVAKHKRRVRAFALFHYYPARKVAFFAYMVVDRNTAGLALDELARALAARISNMMLSDRLLKHCKALLFEVEDPRVAPKSKQLHDIARVQRFCSLAATQSFTLKAFDIRYLQPALSLPEKNIAPEQPLLLISARHRQNNNIIDIKSELQGFLEFIYFDLYPEGFSDIPEEQQAYKEYCQKLHGRVLAGLPPTISIINPAHLICGRSVRGSLRRPQPANSNIPLPA